MNRFSGQWLRILTRARYVEPGSPFSREKAHVILDAVAVIAIPEETIAQRIIQA